MILLYLTAVRGCSYAEGAQRDSNAIPLRVPARGGVWLIWLTFGVAPINRSVARFCISLSSGIKMFARESETRVVGFKSLLSLSRVGLNTKSYMKWIRLTADCREFVRPHGANVQFRFASVSERENTPVRQQISNYACSFNFTRLVMVLKFRL